MTIRLTGALLKENDIAGPRYTSYPTAVEFHEHFNEGDLSDALDQLSNDAQLAVYLHIPFCQKKCLFCGCNSTVCNNTTTIQAYTDALASEMDMYRQRLPASHQIIQIHFGGGTPSVLSNDQFAQLNDALAANFSVAPQIEKSIEVNPAVTSEGQLEMLRGLGFNRLSFGAQDFSPQVLDAIGRDHPAIAVKSLINMSHQLGYTSVNLDLIYGLPYQTESSFAATLEQVVDAAPDRIAMYSFAHIPWIMPHQKQLPTDALPSVQTKFNLFALATNMLGDAGYLQIGMDHFARPDDELTQAMQTGLLHRNFMGYTVTRSKQMLGLGASSIGFIHDVFSQNIKEQQAYIARVNAKAFPVQRGYRLQGDDALRAEVISCLMCNFVLDFRAINERYHIDCNSYFRNELTTLNHYHIDGKPTVELTANQLKVTAMGKPFIRNLCMAFDSYLKQKSGNRPLFSRTV